MTIIQPITKVIDDTQRNNQIIQIWVKTTSNERCFSKVARIKRRDAINTIRFMVMRWWRRFYEFRLKANALIYFNAC